MRRDVLRVGLGRLAFELALGVTLLLASNDLERSLAVALALLGAIAVFAARTRWTSPRTAFFAAHLALAGVGAAAIVGTWQPAIRIPGLALTLGAAIEMTHGDITSRRRIHETLDTFRWPRSVVLRRIGSVIVASAGARAMVTLEANVHLAGRMAVIPLLVALGAWSLLSAGFAAGPGRPRTRPIDAVIFLGLASVLALCPLG